VTDFLAAYRGDGAGFPALDGPLPVNPQDLSHQVVQTLRSAIISGRLRPGEFIRIGAAAEALGVSATPIREALVTLRGDGFVELLPNRGFRVSTLSRQDIEDAYLVHEFIAGELAARSALTSSDEVVARLEDLQAEIASAFESGRHETVDKANEEFHRLIYAGGNSPKLGLFLGIALRYVPNAQDDKIEGWAHATAHDHNEIVEAFRDRDPDRARRAMVAHIAHAKTLLVSHLEAADEQQNQAENTRS
jgi:DNA-binding GntR family transcriptional regulator